VSRTLTLNGEDVSAPPRSTRGDAQAFVSLRYWWGARQLVVERRAYDQAQHDALEARLRPLEAWLRDPANAGHERFYEADGRRQ
jgi:hypothetical protein